MVKERQLRLGFVIIIWSLIGDVDWLVAAPLRAKKKKLSPDWSSAKGPISLRTHWLVTVYFPSLLNRIPNRHPIFIHCFQCRCFRDLSWSFRVSDLIYSTQTRPKPDLNPTRTQVESNQPEWTQTNSNQPNRTEPNPTQLGPTQTDRNQPTLKWNQPNPTQTDRY